MTITFSVLVPVKYIYVNFSSKMQNSENGAQQECGKILMFLLTQQCTQKCAENY